VRSVCITLTVCFSLALSGLRAQNQAAGIIPFESYLEALRVQASSGSVASDFRIRKREFARRPTRRMRSQT
jgi:hypothetical protein